MGKNERAPTLIKRAWLLRPRIEPAVIGLVRPMGSDDGAYPVKTTVSRIFRLLSAGISLYAADALGQNLPNFAPEAYCQGMARVGGERMIYGNCLNLERSAQDVLRSQWASLPSSIRENCIRVATIGNNGSFSMLQGCIGIRLGTPPAQAESPPRRFILVRPPSDQGEAYDSLEQCLAARDKVSPEVAICIYR